MRAQGLFGSRVSARTLLAPGNTPPLKGRQSLELFNYFKNN